MELILIAVIIAWVISTITAIILWNSVDKHRYLMNHGWQAKTTFNLIVERYYTVYWHPDDQKRGRQIYRDLSDAVKRQRLIDDHERLNVPFTEE